MGFWLSDPLYWPCRYFPIHFWDLQGQVDVIYTDIQKASDEIDPTILLSKLDPIGISAKVINLMKSYLRNRVQYVE